MRRGTSWSKFGAARWAAAAFPAWDRHIEAARHFYEGRATPGEKQLLADQVRAFFAFACAQMAHHRCKQE